MNAAHIAFIGGAGTDANLLGLLTAIGADPATGHIRGGLRIIHLGGIASSAPARRAAARFLDSGSGRWTQLRGPGEQALADWCADLGAGEADEWKARAGNGQLPGATWAVTGGVKVRRKGGKRAIDGAGQVLVTPSGIAFDDWKRLGARNPAKTAAHFVDRAVHPPGDAATMYAGWASQTVTVHHIHAGLHLFERRGGVWDPGVAKLRNSGRLTTSADSRDGIVRTRTRSGSVLWSLPALPVWSLLVLAAGTPAPG